MMGILSWRAVFSVALGVIVLARAHQLLAAATPMELQLRVLYSYDFVGGYMSVFVCVRMCGGDIMDKDVYIE